MRLESFPLETRTTPGTGLPQSVRDIREKYVQFSGAFTAVFRVEVSLDGSAFHQSGGDISAPGIMAVPEPALYVRVTTVSYVSGTSLATLNGYNTRTE